MFPFKSSVRKRTKQTRSVALKPTVKQSALPQKSRTILDNFKAFEDLNGEGVVLVGKGTHIVGEITNCSIVEIQGILEGTVSADVVVIRDGGGFKGDFMAEQAEIHGVVEGGVTVHGLLDIRSTGKVSGDVTYEELSVAVGAHISGQINSPATIEAPVVATDETSNSFDAAEPVTKQLNGCVPVHEAISTSTNGARSPGA